ncbi:GP46-like surface antigen, putative [Bodo saltans]|uniref:GP46-like surface antigen, putative n=1 Tax=Bodo saltans TaxID=75058 RepID=A0A0S4JNL2_BODSA|nr:GP46-like surface antigen, putative [Bodo saltans]|eukprot:CUG90873.1 GP46-like surface antigen, putative [Bodo saltans]
MTIVALVVYCVVAASVMNHGATAACVCDTDTNINAALVSLRSSLNISGWTAASSCRWPGVSCSTNGALESLTLCSQRTPCGAGSSLPTESTTWQYLGASLTTLVIFDTQSEITGSFPLAASTSLTALTSITFNSYSPAGLMVLPTGAPTGYTMVLSSSGIAITLSEGANIIALVSRNSPIPDVSSIASLRSIRIEGGTLGTLNWNSMIGLTAIAISFISSALPSWTSADYPSLQSIKFQSMYAASTFPASWTSLTTLTSITIYGCEYLFAPLPSSWSSFANLKSIMLDGTPIVGPLPTSWGSSALTSIGIFYASLSGATFPSTWTQMASLTSLAIVSSSLGGTLPQWHTTTSLTFLSLSKNTIIGPPPTTVVGWGALITLALSNNPINSTIPLWQLANLAVFECSSCGIIGPLPSWGSSTTPMGNLSYINIDNNRIGSSIPATWGELNGISYLSAAWSNITGQMPLTWASPALQQLYVNGNAISGNISTLTFSSISFTAIDLGFNRIGPDCSFIISSSLNTLKLNDNFCSGAHPNWDLATSLNTVDLAGNAFTGSLANLPNLNVLRVDRGNRFTGSLFDGAVTTGLSEVRASNNQFSGTFPPGENFGNIEFLDISANNFVGSVPLLSNSFSLQELNISFNKFTGQLFLPPFSSMTLLDVSCNFLTGPVPSWSEFFSLAHINLTCGNAFSGTLPELNRPLCDTLLTLDATDQGLTGTLSSILGAVLEEGCSRVATVILLGGNFFSGTMPEFMKLPDLERFNVSGSNLTGQLSSSGGTFPSKLWSLDVSHNNALTGPVPVPSSSEPFMSLQHFLLGGDAHNFSGTLSTLNTIFPNLTRFSLSGLFPVVFPYAWLVGALAWVNLTTVILRKCGFSGTFPLMLASTNLKALDLSRNQLGGALPADLPSYVPLLVTLNIGENRFIGPLPANWSNLAALVKLDAHSCFLSGPIPAELPPALKTLILWNNSFSSLNLSSSRNLLHLDISNNNLTSMNFFASPSALTMLNISNNLFPPALLPANWSFLLPSIAALNVSQNAFIGGVPAAWATTMTSLNSLDASSNLLNSSALSLASLLSAFPSLERLWLQHNNFADTLGVGVAVGSALHDLNLANNALVGEIPKNLMTSNLTSLQLQNNFFRGSLPNFLNFGPSLTLLNLSSNRISGPLPFSWGNVFQQATVDLCNNSICGSAPTTLASISTIGGSRCPATFAVDAGCFTISEAFSISSSLCSACNSSSTAQSTSATQTLSAARSLSNASLSQQRSSTFSLCFSPTQHSGITPSGSSMSFEYSITSTSSVTKSTSRMQTPSKIYLTSSISSQVTRTGVALSLTSSHVELSSTTTSSLSRVVVVPPRQ